MDTFLNHFQPAISINHFRAGGGMESYCFDLVREFNHRNFIPTIYANKFDSSLAEYKEINPILINQKLIPKKLRPWFFSLQLQHKKQKHHHLISCNPSNYSDLFICGGTHKGYLNAIQKKANILDLLIIQRNLTNYQTATHIMAHSHLMKQEIVDYYGIEPSKISVVHPPADLKKFFPQFHTKEEILATRKKYGFQEKDIIFLFPSTGHIRKGLPLLADYFLKSNLDIKLVVAGSPLPSPMANVIELGFCQNMPELYSIVDFTIMASSYEPFGLVGIESILCGTKVILSDNIGCTEVLNQHAGFLFSRNHKDSLHEAITQAVSLKKQNQHKLSNPFSALTYNPSSEHHMDQLIHLLRCHSSGNISS